MSIHIDWEAPERQPQNVPHPALPGTIWATADRDGPKVGETLCITFRDGGEVTTYTSTVREVLPGWMLMDVPKDASVN